MLYEQILSSTHHFLWAEFYDVALQRNVICTEFTLKQRFQTPTRTRLFFTSDPEYGVVIPVIVEKTAEGRCAIRIEAGTIVEPFALRYRLMRLRVVPKLLDTAVGDPGSYLLPIAAGVLVDFRERPHAVNSDRLYMEQSEWEKFVFMNCFGRIHSTGNVLAIVTAGDFFCRVCSEFNDNGTNHLCAEFMLRHDFEEMLPIEEIGLYFMECPAGKDYAGLALAYKEYLKSRNVDTLKARMAENPVLQYSAQAMRVKIFCGVKQPLLADGSGKLQIATTFAEAEEIIDAMKEAGIAKAVVTLVGWNLGGHDGAFPTHFPVEEQLGGEEGLKQLIAHAKRIGYQIVPHDNITDIYRGSPDFDAEYIARYANGHPVMAGIWGGGQTYKSCPRVYLERYGHEYTRIRQLGFEGHYYSDAQSSIMWRCQDPRHPANEREYALALSAILEIPRMMFGAVSTEVPATYILPYIDEVPRIHNAITAPKMLTSCPMTLQQLQPRPVPFYHIALHGLLLYEDHWVKQYDDIPLAQLQEIAIGARPSMEISYRHCSWAGNYKECIALIREAYRNCYERLRVQCEEITDFKESPQGVYEAHYENGTVVKVNTTPEAAAGIPPYSWRVTIQKGNINTEAQRHRGKKIDKSIEKTDYADRRR